VFPLWRDAAATTPNLAPKLLELLTATYNSPVTAEDFLAYVACVVAHPAYTERFQADLTQPGLRIPLTAQPNLFARAAELGRRVIWLHTFGEHFADAKAGRPPGPPRLPKEQAPRIPKDGAIPDDADAMPDEIGYDQTRHRLLIGKGFIDNVPPTVWQYEVSGKRVLTQWFSYRKKNRERPIIGDRRPPSKLGDIQPDHWLAEYTTELLNVLHVLALLVELEDRPFDFDDEPCLSPEEVDELHAAAANKWLRDVEETIAQVRRDIAAEGVSRPHLITVDELRAAGALDVPPAWRKSLGGEERHHLLPGFDDDQ
jgi:hypothetical protein